jgi:16S rRNA processing protein RimM
VTAGTPRHIAVARLRKPHGLKGDLVVFPLTSDPGAAFAPGRSLWVVDLAGTVTGGPLVVERSRAYHREWLLKFRGLENREALEQWRGGFLALPADQVAPPAKGEVYLHELEGFAVQLEDGTAVGLVSALYELPAGLMLEVQGPRREFLLPYKREFVREVDREARRLTVALPDGLLDL